MSGEERNGAAVRTLVVWCPDWPVVAAATHEGVPVHMPAAVLAKGRVLACSGAARSGGVRRGMRRRQAQGQCPELVMFADDPTRDCRLFEPVAGAVEELVPGVEVVRSGVLAVPATGPARYFGGERSLAERLTDHIACSAGVECQIGVADGLFAALLAAHRSTLVDPGESAAFLAPLSVAELDQPGLDQPGPDRQGTGSGDARTELVGLLHRLGVRTLGDFAGIPESDVAARFGAAGVRAHRLACGRHERPLDKRSPPPELSVAETLDPPVERVDAAAFVAKGLAERLYTQLSARGLACTRLGISATTEHGEQWSRVWRCAEPLTPTGIADRVRWQLDGWLRAGQENRPTAGVHLLRLDPEETVAGHELQLGLWNGLADRAGEQRAGRALVRVQGLLGAEGAMTAVPQGGRGPAERVRLVPWGDERLPETDPDSPWPGRLPAPSPATVPESPIPAAVLDHEGAGVVLTARGELSGTPSAVRVRGHSPRAVCEWAGPWRVDQRWWDPDRAVRYARIQVVLAGARDQEPLPGYETPEPDSGTGELALLLRGSAEGSPCWMVEGVYD